MKSYKIIFKLLLYKKVTVTVTTLRVTSHLWIYRRYSISKR